MHDDATGVTSAGGAYVTATAVTTRTATTHEDLGKNAKTQQLEEKTVATTTTHNLNRQEQRVVTQEVKTTATVTSGEQVRCLNSQLFLVIFVVLILTVEHVFGFCFSCAPCICIPARICSIHLPIVCVCVCVVCQ